MEGGTVRQQGAPREVYEQPVDEFVAGFLGSPAMTFLRGEVRGGRFRAAGGELPAEGVAGGAAVLGVRPEDWRSGGSGQSGDIPFELEVRLVEDLGSDRFAFGRIGDAEAIVRLPEDGASPSAGERVAIAPDPRRLHWFIDGRRVGATLTRPSE
jgi:ABC-type sugar transport system ATPase subunit